MRAWSEGIVQIAGVRDREEAELLVGCGVDRLGFPCRLATHAEDCSEAEAAHTIAAVRGRAECVLITYLERTEDVVTLVRELGVSWVQLHGELVVSELARLRRAAPELRIMKSLIVHDANAAELERALAACAPHVDAFLTDTFDATTGASGATGKTHDWETSRRLAAASPRPLILAGGLGPHNVREAVRLVRPAGVDAHTGVEGPDGRKRRDLVTRFVAEARAAFRQREAQVGSRDGRSDTL